MEFARWWNFILANAKQYLDSIELIKLSLSCDKFRGPEI